MADFQPTTTIWLFKNTKVSLQNQPYFSSEAAKLSWYLSHDVKTFEHYSYQREPRQYVRVQGKADDLRGYDMLAFRNAPGSRAIFCRVIDVGFVNPNVTEITFETDAMQTFIDVLSFDDSWVEREMVEDDWSGSLPNYNNLIPEGLETGELKKTYIDDTFPQLLEAGGIIIVLSAYDGNAEPNYTINRAGAFYWGLNQILCNQSSLATLLKTYEEKGRLDGIAGIWCVPLGMADPAGQSFTVIINAPTQIDGYTPKNAKCFTSEFCNVEISNRAGDSSFLAPEYFFGPGNSSANIGVHGNFAAGGGGICAYPVSYGGNNATPTDFGVYLPMDAQTCYVGNAFANWVGQNKAPLVLEGVKNIANLGSAVGTLAASSLTGNPVGLALGAKQLGNSLYQSLNSLAGISTKASNPAAANGQANGSGWAMATGRYGFAFYLNTPNQEVIKSIDDFFTVYGYRTCRAKKPNVNTRPFWNYVKCAPACVSGPITMKDKQEIEAILNAGVTFWHVTNGAVIGDYSMDNRG